MADALPPSVTETSDRRTVPEPFERLGLSSLINARGHWTNVGGSLMAPETVAAMQAASTSFVDLPLLLERAGERIAELLGFEAAYITSGAAAGITVSVAACMAGTSAPRVRQLPNTDGLRNEVLMQVIERNYYELMARLAGARVVEFGMAAGKYRWPFPGWHLEEAITHRTAAVLSFPCFTTENSLPLEDVVAIAGARGIPVIVDAADEFPTVASIRQYADLGCDLTVVSGGKGLHGPQSTGLILGKKELVDACAANANPIHGVGRPMKVGKEEIAGIVTAVELVADEERTSRRIAEATARVQIICDLLQPAAGVRVERAQHHNGMPQVHLYAASEDFSLARLSAELRQGDPAIAVDDARDRLALHPATLLPGEDVIVAHRILELTGRS